MHPASDSSDTTSPTPSRVRHALSWTGQAIGYDRVDRRLLAAWRRLERAVDRVFGEGDQGTIGLLLLGLLLVISPLVLLGPRSIPISADEPLQVETPTAPAPVARLSEVDFELQGDLEIVDAVTLRTPSRIVRLAGVTGPDARATCIDAQGRPWACGLRARAALNDLVRGAALRCTSRSPDVPEVEARCDGPSGDVAAHLVAAGWARPTNEARYMPEMQAAFEAQKGLWDGRWTVRP